MITAHSASSTNLVSLDTKSGDIEELLNKEWLLSNSKGSFCSSSVLGCNTRKYHSLLTGSQNPPANRVLALSTCQELINDGNKQIELSHIEFSGSFTGSGIHFIERFEKDFGVHFEYNLKFAELVKSIYLLPEMNVMAMVYKFRNVEKMFDFSVRPFAAMRDFHSLVNTSEISLSSTWQEEGITVNREDWPDLELFIKSDEMWFEENKQWWHNFYYRKDKQRQQDCRESLWSPGMLKRQIDGPCRIVIWASIGDNSLKDEVSELDIDIVVSDLDLRHREIVNNHNSTKRDAALKCLYAAANEFVVERNVKGEKTNSILAGFPWFLDWGRDTFIALEGLLLETEKYDEALSVLKTFAGSVCEGMIPNRFDDYGDNPHYNSIDASLWFIEAAFKYHNRTHNTKQFNDFMIPTICEIIERYTVGTRFGIHCDEDGLVMGGSEETQLTWMDAKCNNEAFTPRYGKTVEVNALWYNALCNMAEYYRIYCPDKKQEDKYSLKAQQVEKSFNKLFWNDSLGWLADCVLPDGTQDMTLRPNQIFAVSLSFSPLSITRQSKIIEIIEKELLTPYGLRSLSNKDPRYKGRYLGNQYERDSAYHQGTVWGFLIGPYIEGYLRVNDFSNEHKQIARTKLKPLLHHMMNESCLGSVSEIFDGEAPHTPRGCFAQAWSVASLISAYKMTV